MVRFVCIVFVFVEVEMCRALFAYCVLFAVMGSVVIVIRAPRFAALCLYGEYGLGRFGFSYYLIVVCAFFLWWFERRSP